MTVDQFLWALARVCGLSAYATLAISVVTGIALRSAVLDWLGTNRVVRSLHEYTTALWIPLAILHVIALLVDATARVGWLDVFVPFHAGYGTVGIGLGALAVDVLMIVTVAAWFRRRMNSRLWIWVHRLAYLAFALVFVHALLTGTDFSDPAVSAITWGTAGALAVLASARAVWGRLPA